MRDYIFSRDDGSAMTVTEMPTSEIIDTLNIGLVVMSGAEQEQNIIERLKIELLIRELNL